MITAPNAAFTQIKDNEEKYFVSSVAIFLIASVITLLVLMPFVMMPLDDMYYESFEENDIDFDIPASGVDIVLFVGVSIITGIISNILFYFIGKKLGGNTNWKKVFSVMFYAYVPAIPMMVVLSGLMFLVWGSIVAIDLSYLMTTDMDEENVFSLIMPILGYAALMILVAIVFFVWIIVVSIKGLKVLNGFSTAKAFGLVILVIIISSLITAPLGI